MVDYFLRNIIVMNNSLELQLMKLSYPSLNLELPHTIKDINTIEDCYKKFKKTYCKNDDDNVKCINTIIYNDLVGSMLYQSPLNANIILISNIIFIIYLAYMKLKFGDNKINDIEKYLQQVITTNKKALQTKNKNISKFFPNEEELLAPTSKVSNRLTPEETEKLLAKLKANKEQRLLQKRLNIERKPTNRTNKLNVSKMDYKSLIEKFKNDSLEENEDKNFIVWYCKWKKYIDILYKNSQKIYKWLDINLKGRRLNTNDKGYYNMILKDLANPEYKSKGFGNKYSFVLVIGMLVKRLKRKNVGIYNNVLKDVKIFYKDAEEIKDNILDVDNILDAILKQLEFFNFGVELSEPFTQLYTDFNSIVANNKNCFSKALNDTYYYRYLISLVNLKGNSNITLNKLLERQQNLELVDVMDLGTKIDKNILQKLSPKIIQKIFKTSVRNKMYVWVSTLGYIVVLGEIQKNQLVIKTIGHRLMKSDKFTLTEYDKDKINVNVENIGKVYQQILGAKKQINIICDNITINLIKNKQNSLTIRWNNSVFYVLVYDDNKYKLKALCIDKISPPDIAHYFYQNDGKELNLNLTIFGPVEPFEVMLIFSVGFAIKSNFGRIFNNISSNFQVKTMDCMKYRELVQNFNTI